MYYCGHHVALRCGPAHVTTLKKKKKQDEMYETPESRPASNMWEPLENSATDASLGDNSV